MHSSTMRSITAALLMACTCIPGMHADSTTTFGFGGTVGTGGPPPPTDPGTAPLIPPAPPVGKPVAAPVAAPAPVAEVVVVAAPAPAPSPALDLDDPEVFAAFLEDYQEHAAEGPEGAVTGPLTGSLPKDSAPAAAPLFAPLAGPAFGPAPAPLSAPCGGEGEECCYQDGMDLACNPGYACDVFSLDLDGSLPTCKNCGGVGELCCFGEDSVFECMRDGIECDFMSGDFVPTCMESTSSFGGKSKQV